MVFTGEYEHAIDAKNRLAIPAELREQLRKTTASNGPTVLYITLGERRCLCLYDEAGFEQRAEELRRSDADPDRLLAYESLWFSLARRVELDSAGRIRLPENLLGRTKLGRQVALLGMNDHMEIRDRDDWRAYVEQVLEQEQQLLNPRRMRRGPTAP